VKKKRRREQEKKAAHLLSTLESAVAKAFDAPSAEEAPRQTSDPPRAPTEIARELGKAGDFDVELRLAATAECIGYGLHWRRTDRREFSPEDQTTLALQLGAVWPEALDWRAVAPGTPWEAREAGGRVAEPPTGAAGHDAITLRSYWMGGTTSELEENLTALRSHFECAKAFPSVTTYITEPRAEVTRDGHEIRLYVGETIEACFRIENRGPTPLRLELPDQPPPEWIRSRVLSQHRVPAGGHATLALTIRCEQAGRHQADVRVLSNAAPRDGLRWRVIADASRRDLRLSPRALYLSYWLRRQGQVLEATLEVRSRQDDQPIAVGWRVREEDRAWLEVIAGDGDGRLIVRARPASLPEPQDRRPSFAVWASDGSSEEAEVKVSVQMHDALPLLCCFLAVAAICAVTVWGQLLRDLIQSLFGLP